MPMHLQNGLGFPLESNLSLHIENLEYLSPLLPVLSTCTSQDPSLQDQPPPLFCPTVKWMHVVLAVAYVPDAALAALA